MNVWGRKETRQVYEKYFPPALQLPVVFSLETSQLRLSHLLWVGQTAMDLPGEVAFEVDIRKSFQHRAANHQQAGWGTNVPFINAKQSWIIVGGPAKKKANKPPFKNKCPQIQNNRQQNYILHSFPLILWPSARMWSGLWIYRAGTPCLEGSSTVTNAEQSVGFTHCQLCHSLGQKKLNLLLFWQETEGMRLQQTVIGSRCSENNHWKSMCNVGLRGVCKI